MEKYKSEVKGYKRRNSKQYLVPLRKEHPFIEGETVLVLRENDIILYEKKISFLNERCDVLLNDMDRLRNKHDHLQERLNKSQEEIIKLERELTNYRLAVSKVQNLSFMDRLLNKLPEEVKQLESQEKKRIKTFYIC